MRRKEEKQVKLRSLLIGGLVIAILAVWLISWQWNPMLDRLCRSRPGEPGPAVAGEESPVPEQGSEEAAMGEAASAWSDLFGGPPVWPADFASPASCQDVEERLMKLCGRFDRDAGSGGSCALLKGAAEDLAARPPRPASELRRLDTILANAFHFFRVLRGERMDVARRMLTEDRALAEPAAMTLYRWLISREQCARSGKTAIRIEPMYDYAGFFFQTIGGQAYLRRRAPSVEALASFYALLVLDRALQENHNPHGLDPRPEIARTRELIAAGNFIFTEQYIEILDDMEERWSAKEPS